MEQCKDCLRWTGRECEAFIKTIHNCWARETDPQTYIRRMNELLRYNQYKMNPKGVTMAYKSIRRVKEGLHDMSKLSG
jgi:hypothetical protein